ncbi:unnamed protein product [Gongylonema pulchrum]|uniref:Uncharacterized protein n=1 Tax=Gongylonema pulchrum TaxID=637853 RepID=A0A183EGB0_9BILA|nr:unnamed protein product [Gongylonema pulchrum]
MQNELYFETHYNVTWTKLLRNYRRCDNGDDTPEFTKNPSVNRNNKIIRSVAQWHNGNFRPTYVSATFAYTSVVFVTGTLSWWGPTAIQHSYATKEHLNNTDQLSNSQKNSTTFLFGLITVVGGIVGVFLGTVLAQENLLYQTDSYFQKIN